MTSEIQESVESFHETSHQPNLQVIILETAMLVSFLSRLASERFWKHNMMYQNLTYFLL